jgi:HEAT repeats
MPTLLLCRATPLLAEELERLPRPMAPVSMGDDVVARAIVDLPTVELTQLAFNLGRAFADCTLRVEETALVPKPAPAPPAADPWALAKEGLYEEAEKLLAGTALDSAGRDRLRVMLGSNDPRAIVFACHVAASTQWKSIAVNLRSVLGHADPQVRIAAVTAIGALAGPAMGSTVKPLTGDADPQVRAAAEAAMKALGW